LVSDNKRFDSVDEYRIAYQLYSKHVFHITPNIERHFKWNEMLCDAECFAMRIHSPLRGNIIDKLLREMASALQSSERTESEIRIFLYIYIYIYDDALVYSDEIAQLVKPGRELGTPATAEIRRRILRATQCRQLWRRE